MKSPGPWWPRRVWSATNLGRALGRLAGALWVFAPLLTVPAADTLVTVCNEVALRAALEAGGTVTLACDGTLLLTNTLVIAKDVVLDGTGRKVTLDGRKAVRVLLVQPNIHLTLRHLTVTGGRADQGGGLLNNGGAVVLLDSVFHSNQAVGSDSKSLAAAGGAVYSSAGEIAATNTLFLTNTAIRGQAGTGPAGIEARGGAVASQNGVLKLQGCVFVGNTSTGGAGARNGGPPNGDGWGGAVSALGDLVADHCLFEGNACFGGQSTALNGGHANGGALSTTKTAILNHCLFSANYAWAGAGASVGINGNANGGAVCALGALQILHSTFAFNWVEGPQGAIGPVWFSPRRGNSTGGALYSAAVGAVTNSTWFQNRAVPQIDFFVPSGKVSGEGPVDGAAIYQTGNPLALAYCTIASNAIVSLTGLTSAGLVLSNAAVARLTGCLLSGNPNANLSGSIVDDGFNLSSDRSALFTAAGSRNEVDPQFGAFGHYGGLTPTLPLLPGSPAIDAVPAGAWPATDQRGVPRPIGAGGDIGAFEFVPAPGFVRDSQGAFRFAQVLQPARDYQIEASSDLSNWIRLFTTRSDAQGHLVFTDGAVTNSSVRFYRALPQ